MDLSCEITRTCARVLHLTTGTFNLIVKDRIALRLSGANSVRTESHELRSACPRNLSNLACALAGCQPVVPTGFPPRFAQIGELRPSLGSSFADSKARFRTRKPMPLGTSQGGSKQLQKRPVGGYCDER